MSKIKHITRKSDKRVFNWLLENERHACESLHNSHMIRTLVIRHNEMADTINEMSAQLDKLTKELGIPKKYHGEE